MSPTGKLRFVEESFDTPCIYFGTVGQKVARQQNLDRINKYIADLETVPLGRQKRERLEACKAKLVEYQLTH